MASEAFEEKTFGIKNITWLKASRSSIFVLTILISVATVLEFLWALYYHQFEKNMQNSFSAVLPFWHLCGFICLQTVPFFLITGAVNIYKVGKTPNFLLRAELMLVLIFLICLYEFNPFIAHYYQQGDTGVFFALKYTFLLRTIFEPIFLSITIFSENLFHKMAQIEGVVPIDVFNPLRSFELFDRALDKKNLGVKNRLRLNTFYSLVYIQVLIQVVVMCSEWVWHGLGFSAPDDSKLEATLLTVFHGIIFLVPQISFFVTIALAEETNNYWKFIKITGSIAALTIIYLYNPWAVHYRSQVMRPKTLLKYTFLVQSVAAPVFFINIVLAIWILWEMSKVKPDYDGDEPYEVIYGGEGSSTKKMSEESTK